MITLLEVPMHTTEEKTYAAPALTLAGTVVERTLGGAVEPPYEVGFTKLPIDL